MSKHRCCCGDCSGLACDWWPCWWHITFGGGIHYFRQRWLVSSSGYYVDCNGTQVDGPALMACLLVSVSAGNIAGDACLSNYGNEDCVCGYTSPAWDGTYSSANCAAGDLTVTVTATRQFTLHTLSRCAGSTNCTGTQTDSVTQTVTKDCTYRLTVECNPVLGPFGQTYTDGRIRWRAAPIGVSSQTISFPDRPAFLTDCGGLAYGMYNSSGGNSTFNTPSFEAWSWPTAASGVMRPANVAEYPFGDAPWFNDRLGYGAGVLTTPCQTGRVDIRDHISLNTYNTAEFGLTQWVAMSVPTTSITAGTTTTP